MPKQKPGSSKQDYGTPLEFLREVEHNWGPMRYDLAATAENKKAPLWLGPGSPIAADSLHCTWDGITKAGNLWLNPPYENIGAWARKCCETEIDAWGRIFLLVPASIGSEWFARWVWGHAEVLALRGRLTFEGCLGPYPKDCILAIYGEQPGFDVWDWRRRGEK